MTREGRTVLAGAVKAATALAAAFAFAWVVRCLGPGFEPWSPRTPDPAPPGATVPVLRAEGVRLGAALAAGRPSGPYIVIDTANNRLWMREGNREVFRAVCSTGSRIRLTESATGRGWEFRTPRGAYRVKKKMVDPLWRKPDWAFIEENQPVPRDPDLRFESGALGARALYFGDGYLIHGTLYERLLGRSVTHGCVRLGREDLDRVYDACPLGTPVYIF